MKARTSSCNAVLHRANLDRVDALQSRLPRRFPADRLAANTQYLGWALPNREALPSSKDAIDRAREIRAAPRAGLACALRSSGPSRLRSGETARVHGRMGAPLHYLRAPTASFFRVTRRTRSPGSRSRTCEIVHSAIFGQRRARSAERFAATFGCPSPARAAIGSSSISADAAVKRTNSRAMRRRPIRGWFRALRSWSRQAGAENRFVSAANSLLHRGPPARP